MISMISITTYNLVDSFWVAKLGTQALAALTATLPYFIFTMAVAYGTGTGLNVLIARKFGEKDTEAANHAAGQVYWLAAVIGVLFLIPCLVLTRPILRLCGATPDTLELGYAYLFPVGFFMPFFVFQIMVRDTLRASGDAVRPMIFTITGQLLNLILDPILIFGWWIFPEMGMAGAAVATVISAAGGAGLALLFMNSKRSTFKLKNYHLKPDMRVVREIYRIGLPAMLMQTAESFIFLIFNRVVSGFGSAALGAMGISTRICDLAFIPVVGVGNGVMPIVGFSLGAKLWQRLWKTVRMATWWLAGLMAVVTVLMEIFAPQIVGIFNHDPELIAVAVPSLRIFLSTMAIVAPTVVFISTLQGLSKARDVLVLALARQFIFFLPSLFILPHFFGITGVWLAWFVSDCAGFITSGLWLWHEYRRQKKSGMWLESNNSTG
ncbi:MAG: MATE family efflux transporter [Dehalococcoidales bacterium]|nr:MATE family efflux transporter [Dehalococcoidales bacterium]